MEKKVIRNRSQEVVWMVDPLSISIFFFFLFFFPFENFGSRDLVIFSVIWPILRLFGTFSWVCNVVCDLETVLPATIHADLVVNDTHMGKD